jgi:hypothetical protein
MLIVDGSKYNQWVPKDEKQLEELVKKNFNAIFGKDSLYFDMKPELRSNAGIGSKPDGLVIVFDKPAFYIVEDETAEHGVHDHVVTQISKFNSAFKKPETKKKIVDTIYDDITSDPFKNLFVKSRIKDELYKFLTEILSSPPTVVVIIDELVDELKDAVEELPLKLHILEFRTFAREDAPNIYAHLFEPIHTEKPMIKVRMEKKTTAYVPPKLGEITPQSEFALPILESIIELDGSAKVPDVLARVHEKMKTKLKKKDFETLPSGSIRWPVQAAWERNTLKHKGYLKKGSPSGIWEITDEGRKFCENQKSMN